MKGKLIQQKIKYLIMNIRNDWLKEPKTSASIWRDSKLCDKRFE